MLTFGCAVAFSRARHFTLLSGKWTWTSPRLAVKLAKKVLNFVFDEMTLGRLELDKVFYVSSSEGGEMTNVISLLFLFTGDLHVKLSHCY